MASFGEIQLELYEILHTDKHRQLYTKNMPSQRSCRRWWKLERGPRSILWKWVLFSAEGNNEQSKWKGFVEQVNFKLGVKEWYKDGQKEWVVVT